MSRRHTRPPSGGPARHLALTAAQCDVLLPGSGCKFAPAPEGTAGERRGFDVQRPHVLLRREGLVVNHKRTERLREESLSLRSRPKRKRPCVLRSCQLMPTCPDEQWGMDFVSDSLESSRRIRILAILDLWDRSCPALEVDISLSGQRVVQVLERLRLQGRLPQRLFTDNGPEFTGRP